MTRIGVFLMGGLAALAIAGGAPKREGPGGRGFDFGGLSPHDKPPLAKDDGEKRILGVLDEMSKGRWYLNVTTREGRFLRQVTEAIGAKRVVEIGTSSGYSTIWLALGARGSGGRVITHDMDPKVLRIARENFEKAGVEGSITIVEGDAHETVKKLEGPIDLVFLDADKRGYIDYLEKLLPLVRPGGLILGHDMNGTMPDPRYIEAITTNPDLDSSFILMENYGISLTVKKR
ncbi:MAG: O-methyltransferase [Planctomycetes bacterium]|nr:O-methyltransferase [Planctomycetota bacterium]